VTLTLAQGVAGAGAVDMHVHLLHRRLHHQRQLREVPSTRHMYLLFRLARRRLNLVQHVCGHRLCMKRCQLYRYWHFRQIPPAHFPTAAPHNKAPVAVGEFVEGHVGALGRLVGVLPEVDDRFVARLVVGESAGTRVVVLSEFVQGKAPAIDAELVGTRVVVLGRPVGDLPGVDRRFVARLVVGGSVGTRVVVLGRLVPVQAADCRLVARLVVVDGSVEILPAVDCRLVARLLAIGRLVGHLPWAGCRHVARLVVADGSVGTLLTVDYRLVPRAAAAGKLGVILPEVDHMPVARFGADCIFLDARLVVAGTLFSVGDWYLPPWGVH